MKMWLTKVPRTYRSIMKTITQFRKPSRKKSSQIPKCRKVMKNYILIQAEKLCALNKGQEKKCGILGLSLDIWHVYSFHPHWPLAFSASYDFLLSTYVLLLMCLFQYGVLDVTYITWGISFLLWFDPPLQASYGRVWWGTLKIIFLEKSFEPQETNSHFPFKIGSILSLVTSWLR